MAYDGDVTPLTGRRNCSTAGRSFDDRDHILDFNRGEGDLIDLHFLSGQGLSPGEDPMHFVSGISNQAGTVWAQGSGSEWTVFVNVDGGVPDMAIDVTLVGGATSLIASDFIL